MTGTALGSHDQEWAGHKKIHRETAERERQTLAASLKVEEWNWRAAFLANDTIKMLQPCNMLATDP
jgi:hypothetical protein